MPGILIGTSRYCDEIEMIIRVQLAKEIDKRHITLDKFQAGKYQFLALNIIKTNSLSFTNESFLEKISKVIAKVYIDLWEKDILLEISQYEYPYFNKAEIEYLKNKALDYLDGNRERVIQKKVYEILRENEVINLDGFILFRLQNELNEIYDSIDRAVEEQILEKEYQEFIKIVQYFLELQPFKVKIIQVFWENGKVIFVDEQFKKVEDEFLDYLQKQQQKIYPEDLLLSALISLAPEKVIIHRHNENLNLNIRPIMDIFAGRLEICEKCEAFGL